MGESIIADGKKIEVNPGDVVPVKSLHNTDISGAHVNVPDIQVFGEGDAFKLILKASSEAEGWMKSTKAMEIQHVGCLVQVTTQQRNKNGSYTVAEAVTFVPGVRITEDTDGQGTVIARHLVKGAAF